MGTPTIPPAVQNPGDLAASYKAIYDTLTEAYWSAADDDAKKLIRAVQQPIGDLMTALDVQELAVLTQKYAELKPKIDATNQSLADIKAQASQIITDIGMAGKVVAGITKLLSMFG